MTKEIKLGCKVKDIVTGLTGIVIAKMEYLNGCIQYAVRPKGTKEETYPEAEYIDYEQLIVVDNGVKNKKRITNIGGEKGIKYKDKLI